MNITFALFSESTFPEMRLGMETRSASSCWSVGGGSGSRSSSKRSDLGEERILSSTCCNFGGLMSKLLSVREVKLV